MKEIETDPLGEIANGAWARLRNLIGALDRVDRLETSQEYAGWLQDLADKGPALQETIREYVLRALRLAADTINWRILVRLSEGDKATTGELSQLTGIERVELVERLNELARAGLTVQPLEGEQVEIASLGKALLLAVNGISDRMHDLAANDYLLNPRSPVPKPETHLHLLKPR